MVTGAHPTAGEEICQGLARCVRRGPIMPGGFRRKRAREEQRVRVDGNGLRREIIGENGIGEADLVDLPNRFDERATVLERQRRSGLALPTKSELRRTADLAKDVRTTCADVVVLASGDLALGMRALAAALVPRESAEASGAPRLHVVDRLEPGRFIALLAGLDLDRTLFNVVSGSGETIATLGHFLVVRDRLLRELGAVAYQQHIVVTTRPGQSPLRQIVNDEGFRDLALPDDVRDDAALLTAAALFPLACAGIDVSELLAGGASMLERCRSRGDATNPAYLLATALQLSAPAGLRVVPPTDEALHTLAMWMQRRLQIARAPESPAATPGEVVALFLASKPTEDDLEIPKTYQDIEPVGYLGGQSLAALARGEHEAVEMACWSAGAPTLTITCPTLTPDVLGQVVALTESAAALARPTGEAPSDHTSTERLAFGIAGRPGYEAERAAVQRLTARREDRYVA